ncbi:MAG: HEAT repeat domain-containing protein [Anaerolineales bacterium]|jgi:HEAT repeat protein
MTTNFDELLLILHDDSIPLPVIRLRELSDLSPNQIDLLQEIWDQIPPSRKHSLLVELGQLADLNFEYSFEAINRFALDDEDPNVRRTAIENLWECEDISLVPFLLKTIQEDSFAEVRASAATALGPLLYLCEVTDLSPALLHEIEECLLHITSNDPDFIVRMSALATLGHSSRPEVIPLIHRAYDHGDDDHKSTALTAMGRSASKDWGPILLTELHNPSPHLRSLAAQAVGEIELRNSIPELIQLLGDVDSDVRLSAIWALGQIGGSHAIKALEDLIERIDDEDEVAEIDEALDHAIFMDSTPDLSTHDSDPN